MSATRHISTQINRSVDDVYEYVVDPRNMSEWAAGLAKSPLEQRDGRWFSDSPMGTVEVEFTPHNDLGVLDHTVTLPSGERVINPIRVLAVDERHSEVVFTLRQRDMTEVGFERDTDAVVADLATLKRLLDS
jgi:hypothetical protein